MREVTWGWCIDGYEEIEKDLKKCKDESRCLADRVFNYLQFSIKKFKLERHEKDFLEAYKEIRSSLLLSDGNPISNAAGIFNILQKKWGFSFTLRDVSESYLINENTVRKNGLKFKPFIDKNCRKNTFEYDDLF